MIEPIWITPKKTVSDYLFHGWESSSSYVICNWVAYLSVRNRTCSVCDIVFLPSSWKWTVFEFILQMITSSFIISHPIGSSKEPNFFINVAPIAPFLLANSAMLNPVNSLPNGLPSWSITDVPAIRGSASADSKRLNPDETGLNEPVRKSLSRDGLWLVDSRGFLIGSSLLMGSGFVLFPDRSFFDRSISFRSFSGDLRLLLGELVPCPLFEFLEFDCSSTLNS